MGLWPYWSQAILVFGNIGLRPYWYLAISVFSQMPNQKLDSRTKAELFGGCSLLWMQETFFTSPCWGREWSLTAGKIFGFAGDRTVMIRYLWFDQWLAANRPMIMTNAWVTSREDGLRQATKSWAAFYTRSRCLWPAWATSVFTEIRKQCPANNRQIRFSNGDRIGQNIL